MGKLHQCLNMLARTLKIMVLALLVTGAAALTGLHARGYRLLSVQTGSMMPAFRPDDALVVAPAAVHQLSPGQVISYRSPHDPAVIISHRLTSLKNGNLITQGDAIGYPDPAVAPRLLVGH